MGKDGVLFTNFPFSNSLNWERFTVILNIPNRKYTIRKHFFGKETQGEFIYSGCYPPIGFHFEISCDEFGLFWVIPLNDYMIFINNERILGKHELKFGSYLTIGYDRYKTNTRIRRNMKFLFIERQFINEISTDFANDVAIDACDFIPGYNDLILSKIVTFLSHSDLKYIRGLSSSWNEAASRILKKRSVIKFDIWDKVPPPPSFLQYTMDMKNMKVLNWEIKLHRSLPSLYIKLLENLNWFLQLDHSLNELKIELTNFSKDKIGVGEYILSKLGKSLKHLELAGNWDFSCNPFKNQENLEFYKLKSLKFSFEMIVHHHIYQRECEQNLFQMLCNMIKACPNVNRVSIPKLHYYISESVLKQLVELSPNLDEIMLGNVRPCILPPLLEIQKPLKILYLEGLTERFKTFARILKKNSDALHSLKFSLKATNGRGGTKIVQLPKLSKLKYLSIEVELGPCLDYAFEFPENGRINYKEHFPSIQTLVLMGTLKIGVNEGMKRIFCPFLHKGAKAVKNLELFWDGQYFENDGAIEIIRRFFLK